MIRLTVEGVKYEFDSDHLLLAEARELKTYTKLTPPKWAEGIEEGDPDATQFLIFLAKKRAGEMLRFSDLDTLDYADLDMEFVDPEPEEPQDTAGSEVAPPADPTPVGDTGTTPTDASTDTSAPSPTTSSTPPPTSTP